jgi:hypothetical protein
LDREEERNVENARKVEIQTSDQTTARIAGLMVTQGWTMDEVIEKAVTHLSDSVRVPPAKPRPIAWRPSNRRDHAKEALERAREKIHTAGTTAADKAAQRARIAGYLPDMTRTDQLQAVLAQLHSQLGGASLSANQALTALTLLRKEQAERRTGEYHAE